MPDSPLDMARLQRRAQEINAAVKAAEVMQQQLDMPCPPRGWELVQALEANGLVIVRRSDSWFECECAHGHRFAVVSNTMPKARAITCPGCGTITMRDA